MTERTTSLSAATVLLLINFLAFFAMWLVQAYVLGPEKFGNTRILSWFDSDLLIKCGADYGPYTFGGEYWRVFTALFLHWNAWHAACNMFVLFRFGSLFERLVGRSNLIAVYVLCGVGGSLASLYWHPLVASAGASAAVLGLGGALVSLMLLGKVSLPRRQWITNLAWLACVTLAVLPVGQVSKTTDNAAHLGGVLTGLCLGAVIARKLPQPGLQSRFRLRWVFAGASAIMVVLFVALLQLKSNATEYYRGELALKKNRNEAAITDFQKYLASKPNDLLSHVGLAEGYERLSRHRDSAAEYRRALEIDPNNPEVQYSLALLYLLNLNRLDDSIPLFRASIIRLPLDSDRYFNFSLALVMAGKMKEAEPVAGTAVALDPKSSRNHSLFSTILSSLGKEDEARTESKIADQFRSAR
jgi:membrane associated rhomboid family serine protease